MGFGQMATFVLLTWVYGHHVSCSRERICTLLGSLQPSFLIFLTNLPDHCHYPSSKRTETQRSSVHGPEVPARDERNTNLHQVSLASLPMCPTGPDNWLLMFFHPKLPRVWFCCIWRCWAWELSHVLFFLGGLRGTLSLSLSEPTWDSVKWHLELIVRWDVPWQDHLSYHADPHTMNVYNTQGHFPLTSSPVSPNSAPKKP